MARKDRPKGLERQIAEREVTERLNELKRRRVSLNRYTVAQDHPGLTYDPELLPSSMRVFSGKQFDELAQREQAAQQRREVTEAAILAKRSDLLVPLAKPTATPVAAPHATTQTQGQTRP